MVYFGHGIFFSGGENDVEGDNDFLDIDDWGSRIFFCKEVVIFRLLPEVTEGLAIVLVKFAVYFHGGDLKFQVLALFDKKSASCTFLKAG